MRLRTRATRRPIVPGLLLAGLCTLTAAAQQSTPPTVLAQDAASPANAKPQVREQRSSEEQENSKNSAPDATTGVSNPDATPATTDTDTAMPAENGSVADTSPAKPATGSVISDVAKSAPDSQVSSATAAADSSVIAVKTEANAAAQTSHPPVAESTQETGETAMPGGSEHPAGPAAAAVPESPASESAASKTPEAPVAAPDAVATPEGQPSDDKAPTATGVAVPPADVSQPAQSTPAPAATAAPSVDPAGAGPPAASAPAAPASSQPATPSPTTPETTPQQPAADPAAPPQQTAPAPPPAATVPETSAPATSAPTAPTASAAPTTPEATSAPAPDAAPGSTPAAETAPASPQTNGQAPAADSSAAPAPAPQDAATPSASAPAAPDAQAVNPSLPARQVNDSEPPPASQFDIFAGYAYLRPSGKVGSYSFPQQNTRGYIASGTYYFGRHLGLQGEFSHSEYPLGTTGNSPAPPFVQLGGVTDSFYTVQFGPVYRFFLGQHVVPFVHFTIGSAKVGGPKFQPPTWGYGFNGGGGVDLILPHTRERVALRLAQADYGYMHANQGPLQQFDLAGGTQSPSALRLSAGLVYRFGEMNGPLPKSLACDATPSEVYAGERVTLAATVSNYHDKANNPFNFRWELSGGKQQGFGPVIFVDTTGLTAGTYHATAHISRAAKGKQFMQCSANFTVKESPAPTVKCSPDPSTVTPGQVSIITAYAGSIAQRQLTYTYTTSEGQISGKDNTAQLHTDGLPPGMATVTCKVEDDLGRSAVATTEVTIAPPALPPAPKAQPLCTVYFNRDMKRPARVDNEGRACLDDVALTMEHQPDARLVLVGEHSQSEVDGQLTAAERAMNTRAYLAAEKGIDPSRVDVRTSTTPGRQVQTYLLAPGAVFDQQTEGRIDETKVKIHGQQYVNQRRQAPQKGPIGEGVSRPPKQ